MKAIVVHEFGSPDVMRFEEIATPEPGEGEVLVRVGAVSVNRGFDVNARAGNSVHGHTPVSYTHLTLPTSDLV